MKVVVKQKTESGAKTVVDPHMKRIMKRLGRDRFKARQVDVPDANM
jgi:endonuclease III